MHNYLTCSLCRTKQLIPEKGKFQLKLNSSDKTTEKLHLLNASLGNLITYQSFEELRRIIEQIENVFNYEECNQVVVTFNQVELPLSQFISRVNHPKFMKIINEQLFMNYVQPIVSLENQTVYGYEFLLRPNQQDYPFFPGELFKFSQEAGLQSLLDSQARIKAIKTSAKLVPVGIKRFVNFLPSSIYNPNFCLKTTFAAAEEANVNPNDLVIEVVETEKIIDINHINAIFDVYKKEGVKVALDDIGTGFSTLELLKRLKPNYAKIGRHLVDQCDKHVEKQNRLSEIVKLAKEYDITVLAEGIERKEEAEFCRAIGIPLAQGYYFGKPQAKV